MILFSPGYHVCADFLFSLTLCLTSQLTFLEPTLGLGYEIFGADLAKVASASVCLEVEVGIGKLVDNIWTVVTNTGCFCTWRTPGCLLCLVALLHLPSFFRFVVLV
jgi:hypothetical protein